MICSRGTGTLSAKRGFLGEAPLVARPGDAAACAPGPRARGLLQPSRGFLVIDDTILEYDSDTNAIDHVAPVWDAETKRYVKGHVVFTAHWVTPGAFPGGVPPEDAEWDLEAPVGAVADQEGATVWRALPDGACSTRGISRRR